MVDEWSQKTEIDWLKREGDNGMIGEFDMFGVEEVEKEIVR